MPRTRFYVYYKVAEKTARVEIRAVWQTARGRGPDLP
jgi:hypothetical protein